MTNLHIIDRQNHKYFCILASATMVVCGAALLGGIVDARADASFYAAEEGELAGQPGTIIRHEPIDGPIPEGASAFRLLYRTTGLAGEAVAASGVLVIPDEQAPESGRPVVAWQHPTSGIDQPCAPSLSPSVLQMIQGLPEMLEHGYVVVATDYPGLGTSGQHPYLVGLSEGRAVLDAVRAARNHPDTAASTQFAAWGHSQGGHATLFAGILAAEYAPELEPKGVAAAAPATDLTILGGGGANTADAELFSAMIMWAWARSLDAPLERLVSDEDLSAVETLARVCFDPPLDSDIQPPDGPMPEVSYVMENTFMAVEPWRSLAIGNSPGAVPSDIPVFLARGGRDTTIPPELTANYLELLCRSGSKVKMVTIPDATHRFVARDAAEAAIGWIRDRFGEQEAPSDC